MSTLCPTFNSPITVRLATHLRSVMALDYGAATDRLHGVLSDLMEDLTPDPEEDYGTVVPVLSEWVLILNVVDLDTGQSSVGVVAPPNMLRSHVIGLLAMGAETA